MMKTTESQSVFSADRLLLLLTVLLLVFGIVFRCLGLPLDLEYDEIWTWQNYGSHSLHDIFTDLATPNNHCLNTLLIQWSTSLFGPSALTIRLPVLIFGSLTLILGSYGVRLLTRSRAAQLLATALIAFQPMLVHYSATARGYAVQSFFVLAMTFLLLRSAEHPREKYTAVLLCIAAVCSCLSVTAGLIFVCAFGGAYLLWLFPWKSIRKNLREYLPFLTAGVLFWGFALCWYGSQYGKLKEGQQFGTAITGLSDLLPFFWNTFSAMWLPILLLILAAVFCAKGRRTALFFLTSLFLVTLSAVFTKAGPPRTYMAMYPVLIAGAALILPELLSRIRQIQRFQLLFVLLLILPELLTFSQRLESLTPPQWSKSLPPILAELPENTLVCYAACDGYPVKINCPDAVKDMIKRLNSNQLTSVVTLGLDDRIEACAPDGTPLSIPLTGGKRNRFDLMEYQIYPFTEQEPIQGCTLLMVLHAPDVLSVPPDFLTGWYCINIHLASEMPARALLLPKAQKNAAEYLQFTQQSSGRIRFYRFANSTPE